MLAIQGCGTWLEERGHGQGCREMPVLAEGPTVVRVVAMHMLESGWGLCDSPCSPLALHGYSCKHHCMHTNRVDFSRSLPLHPSGIESRPYVDDCGVAIMNSTVYSIKIDIGMGGPARRSELLPGAVHVRAAPCIEEPSDYRLGHLGH